MLTEVEVTKIIDKCILDLQDPDDLFFVECMDELVNKALDARDHRIENPTNYSKENDE